MQGDNWTPESKMKLIDREAHEAVLALNRKALEALKAACDEINDSETCKKEYPSVCFDCCVGNTIAELEKAVKE